MIDLRYVKKLVEMLDESSVDSIEISTEKGVKIRISKSALARGGVPMATPVSMPAVFAPAPEARAAVATPPGGEPATSAPAASALTDVKSPMVGTFYEAAEPGAKPFIAVGQRIEKGQVLCIIEAMKIMNEIESEVSGVVREVCVKNAHPVEYGQPLFRIDPNG